MAFRLLAGRRTKVCFITSSALYQAPADFFSFSCRGLFGQAGVMEKSAGVRLCVVRRRFLVGVAIPAQDAEPS